MTRTPKEDLDLKFRDEALKNEEAHRRVYEQNSAFDLLQRKVILLMSLGCFVAALIVHPYISSLGAILALLARRRP